MSPSAVTPEPTFSVTGIEKEAGKKYNFGATVTGLDLGTISGRSLTSNHLVVLGISSELTGSSQMAM